MTTYAQSAYGSGAANPWRENSDNGWGGHHWPAGVPAHLLGRARTSDGTAIVVRIELVPLVQALVDITEKVCGYPCHTPTGGYTGGYANRPIGGGRTPSAHSRGRAIDIRATDNPQSWTFASTIPPDVIAHWEDCGFYWGGWYQGVPYDTMHRSYVYRPEDVAAHLARARKVLAEAGVDPDEPPAEPRHAGEQTDDTRPSTASIEIDGLSVGKLQVALAICGFDPGVLDGVMGPNTTAAVDKCQQGYGLDWDRYVGSDTWGALSQHVQAAWPLTGDRVFGTALYPGWSDKTVSGSPRYSSNQPGMSLGEVQKWIAWYQHVLHFDFGAPGGTWIDGVYGTPTDGVTRQAQGKLGIATDGLCGTTTWSRVMA